MRSDLLLIAMAFALTVILTSCPQSHDPRLTEIASEIDSCPDSTVAILKTLDGSGWSRADSMYAALLTVKAKDKAYIETTSDSAILPLLDYYIEGDREKELHPLVNYYAGRTYRDIGKPHQALKYFRQAARLLGENGDPRLLDCINSQISGLYFDNHLYRHALESGKKQLKYSLMNPDSVEAFNTRLSLAFKYRMLDILDSAEMIYRHLALQVDTIGCEIAKSKYHTQVASFLIRKGRYQVADSLISSNKITWDKGSSNAILHILNEVDSHKNDSTYILARAKEILRGPDLAPRQSAEGTIAAIYRERGELDSAMYYTNLYANLSGAILDSHMEPLAETEKILESAELENDNLLLRNGIKDRNILILVLFFAVIILAAAIWMIRLHSQLKSARNDLRIREIREETKKIIGDNRNEIDRLNKEVKLTKEQLADKANRIREITSGLNLRKVTDEILQKSTRDVKSINKDDFGRLETALYEQYPKFIPLLKYLHLPQRDFNDAMLIKINLPQKICAAILGISVTGLASARKRLLEKHGLSGTFKSWTDYIQSL